MTDRDEAFEKWWKGTHAYLGPFDCSDPVTPELQRIRDEQAAYVQLLMQPDRKIWSAALSAARQGVEIEGVRWQLVPVIATGDIRDAANNVIDETLAGLVQKLWAAQLSASREGK